MKKSSRKRKAESFSLESKEERVVSDAISSDNFSEEIEDEEIEDSHESMRSADKKGFFIIKH